MAYWESVLAGYVGVAIMVLGVVLTLAPGLLPFVPEPYRVLVSEIVTLLGGLKAWLALNPFSQIVQTPAIVAANARNVTVVPAGAAGVNTKTLATIGPALAMLAEDHDVAKHLTLTPTSSTSV